MRSVKFIRAAACAAAVVMLSSVVSCAAGNGHLLDKYLVQEEVSPTDQVVLLKQEKPLCSLVLSDDMVLDLRKNRAELLNAMGQYFNIVINKEIEKNVIYIRANDNVVYVDGMLPINTFIEQFDAKVENERNQKILSVVAPLMEQAVDYGHDAIEAGMTEEDMLLSEILSNSSLAAEEALPFSESVVRQRAEEQAAAEKTILGQSNTVCKKALPYSSDIMKEQIAQRTSALYRSSYQLLSQSSVRSLKYKDYYISSNSEEIAIVCGSVDSAQDAFDYLRTGYIEDGVFNGNYFMIDKPKNEIHEGRYLESKVSGNSLNDYTIIYQKSDEYYDSEENAEYLNDYFLKNLGKKLNVKNYLYNDGTTRKIVIGKTPYTVSSNYYEQSPDICSYQIDQKGDDLYILGGSDWAIQYAIDYMIQEFFSQDKNIPKDFHKSGSIYGMTLFDKYEGANLRIMTSNVWDKPCNTNPWKEVGEDCSNRMRYKEIAKVYMACDPDVLALQEMSYDFVNSLVRNINESGRHYKVADHYVAGVAYRNFTPLLYNQDTVELLDGGSHVFKYASNSNSKSYTWGYFRDKATDAKFIVFSTHLWWQSNAKNPKSSYYREKQLAEVCTKANELMEQYNCPCFVMGDLNCTVSSKEFGTLSEFGFADCHNIATQYSEDASGRYICNGRAFSYKTNDTNYRKSLDHIAVKNLQRCEVLAYDYVTPNFYGKLSDHAPLFIDVKMK